MKNQTRFKLTAIVTAGLSVLLGYWLMVSPSASQPEPDSLVAPKYVFIFLADGAGIPHMEIARQYGEHIHGEGLVITDKIIKEGALGLMTTHAADSLSTDSAAAATALASGCKANNGMLGICADGSIPKTVMELAKDQGMRIGLVTNSTVYDASPAAFLCHVPNRRLFSPIIDRYLQSEVDLLLGGGRDLFLPQDQPGSRRQDGTDMIASFVNNGYRYASNKSELERIKGPKVLGLFSLRDMNFEIDRDREIEPSVHDMTREAIRLLDANNSRGFVLFIENENIDSAAHLTDVASVIYDFREFDRAVGAAYQFYRKHPRETLILVTSDHETGGLGLTMALKDPGGGKGANQVAATSEDLQKLRSIPISLRKAAEILGPNPTPEGVDRLMAEYFKGFTLAPEFKEAIVKKRPIARSIYSNSTTNALGMMVANNTQAYWLTTSHTNHPVFVAALGVQAERFRGYQDNTDFGKNLMAILQRRDTR